MDVFLVVPFQYTESISLRVATYSTLLGGETSPNMTFTSQIKNSFTNRSISQMHTSPHIYSFKLSKERLP